MSLTGTSALPPLRGMARDRFLTVARAIAPDVAEAAAAQVEVARPVLLGFSGWPAAGKDTIPKLVYQALGVESVRLHFGDPLRDEVDSILALCRQAGSDRDAIAAVAAGFAVRDELASAAVTMARASGLGAEVTANSRSDEIRRLLQYWATDVRRASDPDYWVRQALGRAVGHIAEGQACFIPSVRFPNDVVQAQALGFVVVRLAVSRETVAARLEARDGLHYGPEALDALLANPAESALDGFAGFDLVVGNDGPPDRAVAAALDYLGGLG